MSESHIKIHALPCWTQYICDGQQVDFGFNFPIFEAENLEVVLGETIIRTGFVVNYQRDAESGTVVFDSPPASGKILTLQRHMLIQRTTDFQESALFSTRTLNDEFDRLVAMMQQVDRDVGRTVRLGASDSDTTLTLPAKSARIGQALAFDDQGNLTTVAASFAARPNWPNLDTVAEGAISKHFTVQEQAKLASLPSDAAANPPQATATEKTYGSETALRSFSPRDVADMVHVHGGTAAAGGASSVTSVFGRTGGIAAASGDYHADQITDSPNKVIMTAAERTKLADMLSVKDFGAAGNGVADDSAAIVAAIAAMPARGGRLYFPAGVYIVSSTITLSKPGIYYGDGEGTIILASSATFDVFSVTAEEVVIADLTWQSSVVRTAGAYVNVTASGNRFRLQRFRMTGAFIGVHLQSGFGATATIAEGQIFNTVANTGICILIDNGLDLSICDVLADGPANCLAGILITQSGDVEMSRVQMIHCAYGLRILVATGKVVASVWANNSFFDNCGVGAELFANGGSIVRSLFDQCWFSSSINHGLSLHTAQSGIIDGVDLIGPHMMLNGADGLNIADNRVKNVRVIGGAFAQNIGSAIGVVGGASEFSIIGARIGNTHGLLGNRFGIYVTAAASSNYIITNNDLRGNTQSAFIDNGTGTKVTSPNLGA